MDPLVPFHGTSIIHVSRVEGNRIHFSQVLSYDYEDTTPDTSYHEKASLDPTFIERERRVLGTNMQGFLNEEVNVVNGKRTHPRVLYTWIGFKSSPKHPFFTWFIEWTGPEAPAGRVQEYTARVQAATLDYDVRSTYIFPPGTIVERIDSTLPWQNEPPHVITYEGKKGASVGTTEAIAWRWS